MVSISPLECFLIGVVVSGLGMGLFIFCLRRAVVRHRQRYPDGLDVPVAKPGSAATETQALHQRLREVEARLADVEEQLRKQAVA